MPAVIVGNLNPDTVEVVANPLAVPPKVKPDNEKIRQYQRCNLTLARLPGASEYHDGQVNVLSCLPDWASCLATKSWASLSLCFHCRIHFL